MDLIFVYQAIIAVLILFLGVLFILFLFPAETIKRFTSFVLTRHDKNPLLSPHELNDWETEAVFNPAAVVDDEGTIHLLYRALGSGGISQIGHASSGDGFTFDNRSGYPVFQPPRGAGLADPKNAVGPTTYAPWVHASGGGWGGCEDPRAVRIGDRVYMTYTAFEGWHSVRMALTSIPVEDLKKNRWNWKRPVCISAPNEVHKNWMLFPEKINGKYAILHSISPDILIEYVDSIDFFDEGNYIKSRAPSGGRKEEWDNWMRGAAAPPVKTDKGWLLLYHAMDKNDPNKYKLGAMILDTHDPTKILYRSPLPILSPDMHYENDWKPGVVYASGAVILGEALHVYYGGGDKYICVAHTNLNELLEWLINEGKV